LRAPEPALSDGVIELRPLVRSDAAAIAAACADRLIARFIPLIPVPYTVADAEAFLARNADGVRPGDELNLGISTAGGPELLGMIGLGAAGEDGAFETGYWVAPAHRNRGVATQALVLLSRWAIDELGVPRLQLQTMVENTASQRVAERAGFTREAVLRRYMDDRGTRRDSVMYSRVPGDP
jgi:RimJ/RimL family protein N-acetyltransferase